MEKKFELYLADQNLSMNTITAYLCGVRQFEATGLCYIVHLFLFLLFFEQVFFLQ